MDFHDRFRWRRRCFLAVLSLGDGIFQHMAVHGKADAGDIAVLFPTQEVAGAADFQVTHGNLEARAEFGEFLDGLQAFSATSDRTLSRR